MSEIENLQKYLLLIRRCVGWSAVEFGDRIGVTRQTINNLETAYKKDAPNSKKTVMSKTQYLAIRKVLDDEIARSPDDTKMLKDILDILVDHPDSVSDEQREELVSKANMIAPSVLAKSATRKQVSDIWMGMTTIINSMAELRGYINSPDRIQELATHFAKVGLESQMKQKQRNSK